MDREKLIVIIITVAAIAIAVGMLLGGVFVRQPKEPVDAKIAKVKGVVDHEESLTHAAENDLEQPAAPKPEPRRRPVRRLRTVQRPQRSGIDVVLREPIFGVYLGESLPDIHNRLGLQSNNLEFVDIGGLCESWFVVTRPKYLKDLVVFSWDDRVCVVVVYFSDATQSNYDAIKQSLLSKYGNMDEGLTGDLFGEVDFTPTIEGIKVRIHMNRDEGFMEDSTITLSYMHQPLFSALNREIGQRKSSVVGGDL